MGFKGAIFDLDGVVVDTVPLHFKAWKKLFEEYGHSFSMDDYLAKVDGKARLDGVRAILTGSDDEDVRRAGDKKQLYFLENLENEPVEVFEDAIELIRELKANGIIMAAASSSKNATTILKKIDIIDYFDVNVSGGDFEAGKPDPEIFLLASSKMGLSPAECVVFEDSSSGAEAAFRGGFFCVGIDRHGRPQDVKRANIIVQNLDEVPFERLAVLLNGN